MSAASAASTMVTVASARLAIEAGASHTCAGQKMSNRIQESSSEVRTQLLYAGGRWISRATVPPELKDAAQEGEKQIPRGLKSLRENSTYQIAVEREASEVAVV